MNDSAVRYFTCDEFEIVLGKLRESSGEIERLRNGLSRVATPLAFHCATSAVDREHRASMFYAANILEGMKPEEAEKNAVTKSQDT